MSSIRFYLFNFSTKDIDSILYMQKYPLIIKLLGSHNKNRFKDPVTFPDNNKYAPI